jgi:hypothetical protein
MASFNSLLNRAPTPTPTSASTMTSTSMSMTTPLTPTSSGGRRSGLSQMKCSPRSRALLSQAIRNAAVE